MTNAIAPMLPPKARREISVREIDFFVRLSDEISVRFAIRLLTMPLEIAPQLAFSQEGLTRGPRLGDRRLPDLQAYDKHCPTRVSE
jgi:hypothetical protein